MRHRSAKNSRKWEDIPFRRDYQMANPVCEIIDLFPRDGPSRGVPISESPASGRLSIIWMARDELASHPHHIAWGSHGACRWDERTNLIHLCWTAHKFCHEWKADGLVCCWYAKAKKGEWDAARMAEICGVNSIAGWLSTKQLRFDWVQKLWEELTA